MKTMRTIKNFTSLRWSMVILLLIASNLSMKSDVVVNSKGKCGLKDEEGNLIVDYKFDYISPFNSEGLSLVSKGHKFGYINLSGEEILPIKYDYIYPFYDGVAQIQEKKLVGLIDKHANLVLKPTYSTIGKFNNRNITWAIRTVEDSKKKIYIINKSGDKILQPQYSLSFVLSDGSSTSCQNIDMTDKRATYIVDASYIKHIRTYYDLEGNVVFSSKNLNEISKSIFGKKFNSDKSSSSFVDFIIKDDVLLLTLNMKNSSQQGTYTIAYVYYDLKKQRVITNYSFDMSEQLVQHYEQTKQKYRTFNNWAKKNAVGINYLIAHPFNEGYARINISDGVGIEDIMINKEGNVVMKYPECSDYENGLIYIKNQHNQFGILNINQQVVIPAIYDSIRIYENDKYAVLSHGKWGVVNSQNDTIIPLLYNDININNEGVIALKNDTNWSIYYQDTIVYDCPMEVTPYLYGKTVLLQSYGHIQLYDLRKQKLSRLYSGYSAIYPAPSIHGGVCFEVYDKFSNNQKVYGYLNAYTEVVLPIIFDDAEFAYQIYTIYQDLPVQSFTEIDIHRLMLKSSLMTRKYDIDAQIPEEDWGY